MLLSYTEYFWSLAPTRIQFGPPFFLSLFFFKKGGPYISKKPIGGWRFFVCANKISRCSLFIASRLQTALSSPRALHLLSSPLNGITNRRIYFIVATKRRGKTKRARCIICVSLFRCNYRRYRHERREKTARINYWEGVNPAPRTALAHRIQAFGCWLLSELPMLVECEWVGYSSATEKGFAVSLSRCLDTIGLGNQSHAQATWMSLFDVTDFRLRFVFRESFCGLGLLFISI